VKFTLSSKLEASNIDKIREFAFVYEECIGELFFLQRETYLKENAIFFKQNVNMEIATNLEA
jgi:hypothetical protein